MKLKLHFIKKWLKEKRCAWIRLHVLNFLYFTKKSFWPYLSICLFPSIYVHLSMSIFLCPSIYVHLSMSIYLCINLNMSIYLWLYLSIYLAQYKTWIELCSRLFLVTPSEHAKKIKRGSLLCIKLTSQISKNKYDLYTNNLYQKVCKLTFMLLLHKFKRSFCSQKTDLKASLKDCWYTKIN